MPSSSSSASRARTARARSREGGMGGGMGPRAAVAEVLAAQTLAANPLVARACGCGGTACVSAHASMGGGGPAPHAEPRRSALLVFGTCGRSTGYALPSEARPPSHELRVPSRGDPRAPSRNDMRGIAGKPAGGSLGVSAKVGCTGTSKPAVSALPASAHRKVTVGAPGAQGTGAAARQAKQLSGAATPPALALAASVALVSVGLVLHDAEAL
eukprot:scaffold11275_cov108-Isochrysis_galbana.AAC.1